MFGRVVRRGIRATTDPREFCPTAGFSATVDARRRDPTLQALNGARPLASIPITASRYLHMCSNSLESNVTKRVSVEFYFGSMVSSVQIYYNNITGVVCSPESNKQQCSPKKMNQEHVRCGEEGGG